MKIFEREYDIDIEKVKGFEIIDPNFLQGIEKCKLTRFIVALDNTQYTIDSEGNPEMTDDAQSEYDDYVSRLRDMLIMDKIRILDEGYGKEENELEWHITCCILNPENSGALAIWEIDTCVFTDESSK